MAQGNEVAKKQATPVDKLKHVLASDSIQQQFKNALADNANLFTASLVDLYAGDSYLQKCEPSLVVLEALKAATLKLPISKSLGFAYIVAYGGKPQFQLGYKGMIQLAMRSGVYKCINAGTVYEGELRSSSKLTGEIDLTGTKISDNPIGYFAYIETINGFKKTMYCNIDDMREHGKKYSKSYNQPSSPWKKEFDGMAEKTMLRMLLGKYGQMSIDMADGMAQEADPDYVGDGGYSDNGNKDFIDVDTDTGEVKQVDDTEASTEAEAEADLKKEMEPGY
jgi:recombination protein RecT